MKHHHREENDCLNCGADLTGKFCANCGQENLNLKESFWHFLGHSVGHYFHFDSKFFNTLKPLLTKPGQLSLDYLAGKRAKYLQPVSLFIFIAVVFFLVTPLFNNKKEGSPIFKINIDNQSANSQNTDSTNNKINEQLNNFPNLSKSEKNRIIDSVETLYQKDTTNKTTAKFRNGLITYNKLQKFGIFNNSEFIVHYGSKIFFLLTPIFAFFLMLNFRKNNKLYLEHVIFTLHFNSFVFILFFIVTLLNLITFGYIIKILSFVSFVIVAWYCYKSLKVFYQRSNGKIIWKMVGLSLLYLITFLISYETIFLITNNLH